MAVDRRSWENNASGKRLQLTRAAEDQRSTAGNRKNLLGRQNAKGIQSDAFDCLDLHTSPGYLRIKGLNEGSVNMSVLWIALFLLHQGYSLVPVVTVQLGESVTLPCAFTEKFQSTTWLHWYKQSAGDNLKLIVMQQKSIKPNYGPDVSASKIEATNDEKFSNITIQKTVIQDEGMYHCAHMDWTKSTWTGTYLSIKGDFSRTSRYNVLQNPTTDAARSANSETLQCSLLSGSEDKMCSGELNVFWFRAGSEKSYPDIIHSNENGLHNCEKTSTLNTQRKCSYNLSKNFSSTDTQTVYCAVATCGEILFGKGTLTKADQLPSSTVIITMSLIIFLAISMIVNIVLILYLTQRSRCRALSAKNTVNKVDTIIEDEKDLNYAALHFSEEKPSKGTIKRQLKTEDSVYSLVDGLN
ncbi:PREDICTED: uncharacterized protein LOC107100478 [Cyprinodon variegatus]|uniref:uncharacterized protein LOC107100478 n=1 Tax=Cyprinodon variegatus TaxID=28743 RepID=UPI0007427D88|nr:PREDICTED: uncharacterized protein LOC107100478 [Cyprinodon variegatus]